jgi:hypothetical protein
MRSPMLPSVMGERPLFTTVPVTLSVSPFCGVAGERVLMEMSAVWEPLPVRCGVAAAAEAEAAAEPGAAGRACPCAAAAGPGSIPPMSGPVVSRTAAVRRSHRRAGAVGVPWFSAASATRSSVLVSSWMRLAGLMVTMP